MTEPTSAPPDHTPENARKVQHRKVAPKHFPTDEESILLRRKRAEKEAAEVTPHTGAGDLYGTYDVASAQWDHPYRVEIRSLSDPLNSCSCQDFMMNRLGTCKHIERVLQVGAKQHKRRFARAAAAGSPFYEIFFDTRTSPPMLRCIPPAPSSPTIDRILSPLFGTDGTALASPVITLRVLQRTCGEMSALSRRRVRMSSHTAPWVQRVEAQEQADALRRAFEQDVAAGKRSDNPVNLPLYPYQKVGMLHLAFKGRALLADEMGLGKTVQAIAAAELLRQLGKVRRVLIVCPASLKAEWEEQLHHFTGRQATLIFGSRVMRRSLYAGDHPYAVMNYEQIRNDVDALNELMLPDLVILDEAQRIKNWPTKTAKTIKRLQSPFAFVLTGTPLENRIEELYSLIEFVDPQVFGSLFRFEREYMEIDPEDGRTVPKNLAALHRQASTVMLRRRKADVETALPKRTDKTFLVAMSKEQTGPYLEYQEQAARLAAIAKYRPLTKQELDRLMQMLACMRMLCDTPYILDPACRICPKLEELEQILAEVLEDPETKVIIFSEWVRMLELVKELLEMNRTGFAEHTGRIPQQKRRAQLRRFKSDPACRVFLSSDAGGTGLNLQAASVVINLDLPWNPAKLEQRIARAWRKHQQRPVRVINIVTEGSIEEEMLGKLAYKTALADSVLDGAAFEQTLKSERGRQSFMERVRGLLGGEKGTDDKREAPTAPETPLALAEDLQARHPQQILAVEQLPDSGPALVIARSSADAEHIRTTLAERGAARSAPVEVIDAETLALLRRLSEQGLIQISSSLTASFESDGYASLAPPPTPPPPRRLHVEAATAHWQACSEERAAAEALIHVNLIAPAQPHLSPCVLRGHEALRLLHTGALDDAARWPDDTPHRGLAEAFATWLGAADADTPLTEATARSGLALLAQLDAVLRESAEDD